MLDTLATNPPVNPNDLINALPTKWQAPIALGVVVAMAIGRVIYAIKTKRSFWGVLGALFTGTNTPPAQGNPPPYTGSKLPFWLLFILSATLLTACVSADKSQSLVLQYVKTSGSGIEIGVEYNAKNVTPEQLKTTLLKATRNMFELKAAKVDSNGTHAAAVITIPSFTAPAK